VKKEKTMSGQTNSLKVAGSPVVQWSRGPVVGGVPQGRLLKVGGGKRTEATNIKGKKRTRERKKENWLRGTTTKGKRMIKIEKQFEVEKSKKMKDKKKKGNPFPNHLTEQTQRTGGVISI